MTIFVPVGIAQLRNWAEIFVPVGIARLRNWAEIFVPVGIVRLRNWAEISVPVGIARLRNWAEIFVPVGIARLRNWVEIFVLYNILCCLITGNPPSFKVLGRLLTSKRKQYCTDRLYKANRVCGTLKMNLMRLHQK